MVFAARPKSDACEARLPAPHRSSGQLSSSLSQEIQLLTRSNYEILTGSPVYLGFHAAASEATTLTPDGAPGQRATGETEEEALLQSILSGFREGIVAVDQGGHVVASNAAAAAFIDAAALAGSPSSAGNGIFHTDRRSAFAPADLPLARALAGETVDDVELFVKTDRNPRGMLLVASGRPVVAPNGRRNGALMILRDITEKRRADAAVQRLAAIVEGSDDAIISFDLDGTIATWNHGAEALYGQTAADMIGESIFNMVPSDKQKDLRETIARSAAGTRIPTFETEHLLRNGISVAVSFSVAPLVDASGGVVALCSIIRDLTSTHHLTRELHKAKEAAEAATIAKSHFLASMSHEIRTPLTALLGFADLLADPAINASDHLNYALVIRRNGEYLLSIINDILDLSKIEAGKLTVERIECSLASTLGDVASLMRVRAVEHGLDFDVQFLTPIPAVIHTDPTRLRQVLLNLVGNAVKFTRNGRVCVILSHDKTTTPEQLRIEVVDTGIGMTVEQTAGLFQPFQQADVSMSRRFGGSGLGLSICKALAHALGGEISVRTAPGKGSTFTVVLALDDTSGIPLISKLEAAQVTSPAETYGMPQKLEGRVLLAEDGPDNQLLLTTLLRNVGLAVTLAENGKVAVDRAWRADGMGVPFDLVLMDMQMPEMDGYAATGELRRRGYRRPIVALTAHAMAGERERCIAAGCDDYVSKPVERARFLATLRRFVGAEQETPVQNATPALEVKPSDEGRAIYSEYADDPNYTSLVHHFVSSLQARVSEIRTAAKSNDRERLLDLVHQLKGSAGGYGFTPITEVAAQVSRALRERPDSDLIAIVEPLAMLCARARIGRPRS